MNLWYVLEKGDSPISVELTLTHRLDINMLKMKVKTMGIKFGVGLILMHTTRSMMHT